MYNILKVRLLKGILTRHIEPELSKEVEAVGSELKTLIRRKFGKSLNIREVDTGSCGACESEIIA